MNIRKTRLWLALTGWLPWACFFGLHDNKVVARRNIRVPLPSGAELSFASQRDGEFHARLCVCRRCGRAW